MFVTHNHLGLKLKGILALYGPKAQLEFLTATLRVLVKSIINELTEGL